MSKETMSGRERWLAVLNWETPDRVPMDINITPEACEKLLNHLGCTREEMIKRFHIDERIGVYGRYVGPPLPEGENEFGLKYRMVDYGTGAYSEVANAPLAQYETVEEIEANYTWPSPDWYDYSHLPAIAAENEDKPISSCGSEPFMWYKFLRGEQQAFIDLLAYPEIVHYCLDKLFELAYQANLRTFEAIPGKVIISYIAEDLGGQDAIMYSPDQCREFLFPRMKRMMDLTKQNGAHVFTHSDGSFREVIPDLLDIGVEVLNPIQWRCKGMDREGLKRDFGDRLIFHGAVDNQYTLPFGSVEEVRQEVIDNYRILGAGGGYILGPCHNIQAVSPPENIIAMYEAGYEYGWR